MTATTNTSIILMLEKLSYRALPALQTRYYDGWVLRFAGGYTRRANSVNPIYTGQNDDIEAKIRLCEALYHVKQIPVNFKMTAASQPSALDDILDSHRYYKEPTTSIYTRELSDEDAPDVMIDEQLTKQWLNDFCNLNETSNYNRTMLHQMLSLIVPKTGYAYIRVKNKTVAVGLGVYDKDYIGLFDIVTSPQYRQQGFGQQIVQGLMAWGKANGAQHAYLQVMDDNEPASNLYRKLGFKFTYNYWYRSRKN